MTSIYTLVGIGLAAALAALYVKQLLDAKRARAIAAQRLFSEISALLEGFEFKPGDTVGSWKATGRYRGELFQYHVVADTLATRKLPSLWLLLTLPKPQPLAATIDVMMRPSGPSTFSQFDFLPHTLPSPASLPPEAIVRSNEVQPRVPEEALAIGADILRARQGKELLLSPKGLRIVIQAAEADRLRYGVFREARFEDAVIDAGAATTIMNALIAMDAAIAGKA